jgi:hypothetical protein
MRWRIGSLRRLGLTCLLAGLAINLARTGQADPPAPPKLTSTVGMPAKIEQLVIPGPELEVKPLEDRRAPLVLRIAAAYPHGSAFRYDLVFYALEPGRYDLTNSLRRKDGSALGSLDPIPVQVDPVLPPGQVLPNPLALEPSPALGGYRWLLAIAASIWVTGLAAILLLGRRRKTGSETGQARPVTLADRIRQLVTAALEGNLSPGQHAELERMLIGYWRKRLDLEQASPAEVMTVMLEHADAGELLRKLEDWLHKPGARTEPVDLPSLLRPYQDLAETEADQGLAAPSVTGAISSYGVHRG